MNSKPKIEKTEITVGQRLIQARETLGFSCEIIAERLCLKVCTVRKIEEDSTFNSIDPTFLRGYIRSYAKLVKIPEKEILALLDKYTPAKVVAIFPMHSYSLGKTQKKGEGWLMRFTWLIIIICISMVVIWWWQGYKIQQQEIAIMAEKNRFSAGRIPANLSSSISNKPENPAQSSNINNVNNLPIQTDIHPTISSLLNKKASFKSESLVFSEKEKNKDINISAESESPAEIETVQLPVVRMTKNNGNLNQSDIEAAPSNADKIEFSNVVIINFTGECWLEVRDANNNILFSGIKNVGYKLILNGMLPYQFHIGVPANVSVFFKGELVDLHHFIKDNRPAKFIFSGLQTSIKS